MEITNGFLSSLSPNIQTIDESRGDVKFFLVYKGDTLQLPVNPNKIQIETPGANKTLSVISLGEINVLKAPKLETISFKSFFPVASTQNYPYVLTGNAESNFYTALIKQVLDKQPKTNFILPQQYVEIIEKIRANKEPIRFIVLGLPKIINGLYSIEKFNWYNEGADYDIGYDIVLKAYKPYAIKECRLNEDGSITIDNSKQRPDNSDSLLAPYAGCEVNVNGTIYKDPAMQFVDRYVKNELGALVGLVDFDNDGAIHLRDKNGEWLGWCSSAAVSKATGML